jgi:putative addiction module component (TIGR02574 family)
MEQDAVLGEALALPEKGRAEVASKLLESLGGPDQPMTDAEAIVEARRRSEEMDRDPTCAITHEDFLSQIRNRRQ